MDAFYTDVRGDLAAWRVAWTAARPDEGLRGVWLPKRSKMSVLVGGKAGWELIMTNQAVAELIGRSNRLGSDPKNTNYAGGNTSAKGTEVDPVTGEEIELVWVKGSAVTWERSRNPDWRCSGWTGCGSSSVYPGVEREDEMVAAFDYCLHGKGSRAVDRHGDARPGGRDPRRPSAPRLRHRDRHGH